MTRQHSSHLDGRLRLFVTPTWSSSEAKGCDMLVDLSTGEQFPHEPALDPIVVEVIRNALLYASEEMGIVVRNASFSPNIKERLDHSCALFDEQGRLIAQAEHIPVHLGSLPV